MTRPPRNVDKQSAANPKARRVHPTTLDPEWAMDCFLDRALSGSEPQAGLFAIAFALTSLVKLVAEVKAEDDARAAAVRDGAP